MKKVFYILVAALIAAVSCDRSLEFNDAQEAGEQGLTLRFSCGDMATRATVDGVSNENLIKQIDYFLFPVNSEGKVTDDTEYAYKGQFTPEDNGLALQYEVTIEPEKLTKIFPDGAKNAVVFAVANYVDKFGAAGNEAGAWGISALNGFCIANSSVELCQIIAGGEMVYLIAQWFPSREAAVIAARVNYTQRFYYRYRASAEQSFLPQSYLEFFVDAFFEEREKRRKAQLKQLQERALRNWERGWL